MSMKSNSCIVPWWHRGLRIWHCHCCGLGCCHGVVLAPDPGTSACYGHSQKKYQLLLLEWDMRYIVDFCEYFSLFSIKMGLMIKIRSLFFFSLIGPHPKYMEVPRLGVELELQLPAYTTAQSNPDSQPTEQDQGSNPHPHGH